MLCDMPNECFRRTNGLVLAKAVMYCEGHKASFSASYIYIYIYMCVLCVSVSFSFGGLLKKVCKVLVNMFLQHDLVLNINIRLHKHLNQPCESKPART